jgi:chitin synthase
MTVWSSTDVLDNILSSWDKLTFALFMLVAIPEWIAFAFAYISSFVNVIRRPEPQTSRVLTVFLILLITAIRAIYLAYFVSVLPDYYVPEWVFHVQKYFMYAISCWWMLILCGPALCGVVSWMINGVGNRRLYQRKDYFQHTVCILPVYNEERELLLKGIDSILDSDFPAHLLEVHVSFDDEARSDLWSSVLNHYDIDVHTEIGSTCVGKSKLGSLIFVHRWPHGGKRHCQAHTWKYIRSIYGEKGLKDSIIILTDSDNFMLDQALNNLSYKLARNPKKIAFAGYMSCMSSTDKEWNLMRMIQDTEYVSSELNRFFELSMGTVNCLPGGFTAIRYTALAKVADTYFNLDPMTIDTITLYHMRVLGEDRWLTHLIHKTCPRYSIGFCPLARCKTDPPSSVWKFIQQRRRWLLGSIANEAYMITSPSLWLKFPLLMLFKVIQTSWRSTSFCQFLIVFTAIRSFLLGLKDSDVYVYPISIGTPIILAYLSACLAGIALKRFKVCFMYPVMVVAQTVLQVGVDFYALFTWRKRTWGGPRVVVEQIIV